jgi:N-sulfoglucosamine sulfohydrolase
MKKIIFLLPILAIITAFSLKNKTKPTAMPPNVIVFIADDLGWEDTNPYGNAVVHTPNIKRLADEGMRFDNFYLTASSCSPSRVSMFTSLHPHNTGARHLHQDITKDVEIFPTNLKDAGYYTMLIGKSHGTNKPEVKQKFDKLTLADWGKPWTMGDMWLTALQERPKDKPFFMWASSIDPHRPFKQGDYPYKHKAADVIVPPYLPDNAEVRADLADYYDEIGRFDHHIGQVLAYLEKENLLENTVLMVVSDNGKAYPQCKTRVNRQGLKSPLIVRYPSLLQKGSSSASLVSAVDLAPTILELAGAKPMQKPQGKSFSPLFKSPQSVLHDYVYGEHNWHNFTAMERVAISKDYIFIKNWIPENPIMCAGEIVNLPFFKAMKSEFEQGKLPLQYSDCFIKPRPAEELFSMENDRHCRDNLATAKKHKKGLKKMQTVLAAWQKETSDVPFEGYEKLKKENKSRKDDTSF